MIKIIFLLFIINGMVLSKPIELNVKEVNKYINEVQARYLKNNINEIKYDYNPFLEYNNIVRELSYSKKGNKKINKPKRIIIKDYKILGIYNNKVNINKKWYSQGSFIDGYKINKLNMNEVNLIKKNKIIKLKLNYKKIIF